MATPGDNPNAGAETPLLVRIARGDQSAVPAFLDRYSGLVWSLARRLAMNDPDAEDAVHEIFIDLWKSAARFDPTLASEVTFVAMVARRRLIDRRRRLGRIPRMESVRDDDVSQAASGLGGNAERGVSSVPETSEEARIAAQELEKLNPEQQRVLRLSIFHGLSHEKIASALRLPLGTVKTHARRGLIRLRESLEARRSKRLGGNPGAHPA